MKRRIFFPVALAALLLTGCSGAAVPEPEPEAVDVVESAAPEEPQETAPENDTEPEGEEPEAEESEDPPEAPELSFCEELALAHYSQRSPRVADEQEITAAEEAAGLEIPADRDCAVAFETDDGDSAVVALWLDRPAAEEDLLGVLEGAGLNMKHLPAEGYTSMQADKGEVSVLLTVIEDKSSAMSNWSMLIPDSAVATLAILFP